MMQSDTAGSFCHGDNLAFLREPVSGECIDLVCLDPPKIQIVTIADQFRLAIPVTRP